MTSRFMFLCVAILILTLSNDLANAAPIIPVAYASLTGAQIITFDDVAGGAAAGTNYDAILESGNTAFAERFAGQTLSRSTNSDVLSGTPVAPLMLQVGAPGQNLGVAFDIITGSQVLFGVGPIGFPDSAAIAEGSTAALFDFDQSELGFRIIGGNGGDAFVAFFRRDGSLIDSIVLANLGEEFYGFSRDSGIKDIAGVSIYSTDPYGIGIDDLQHDVAGVPDVPEPSTFVLLGLGISTLSLWCPRIKSVCVNHKD